MNQMEEVREQFRSVAKGKNSASAGITVEEAKKKFRESASDLDRKIGLENIMQFSLRSGIPFFLMILNMIKAQRWILPFFSGILHFGGKVIESIVSVLTPRPRKPGAHTTGKSQKKYRS